MHTFERGDSWDMCDQSVKLVNGIFIFISLSVAAYTNTEGNIPAHHRTQGRLKSAVLVYIRASLLDSSLPNCLVQFGVNSHIWSLHLFLCKLLYRLDGPRGTSLEPAEINEDSAL